jgi:hypothetical protein
MTLADGELRALPLFDDVRASQILHPIMDEASAPHLRPGEFAVIDTEDRTPVNGELFLIEWTGGRRAIVETCLRASWPRPDGTIPWCAGAYNRPRSLEDLDRWRRLGRPLVSVDGPYSEEHLASKLVGRLVGVFSPSFEVSRLKEVRP